MALSELFFTVIDTLMHFNLNLQQPLLSQSGPEIASCATLFGNYVTWRNIHWELGQELQNSF